MPNQNYDHQVTLAEAAELTSAYRATLPTAGGTLGHYINKSAIESILSQSGCEGIRVYYGLKSDGTKQLVFTGVDSGGNDLFNGFLADRTFLCPNMCSLENPLNSDI